MADDKDAASSSTALVRKRTDMQLMPPPPAPKRIKRPKTVLDEDTYTDGLSKIIARDFFPGLLETESQNEYLNALESKDGTWIASAGKRLREVMTPGRRRTRGGVVLPGSSSVSGSVSGTPRMGRPDETPKSYAGDTPASVRSMSVGPDGQAAEDATTPVDTNVSLATYQSKYTSEDNESFYKLLDRQNQKRSEKHAWLWNGNQLPSKRQLKQKEVEERLLLENSSSSGKDGLVDDGYAKQDRLAVTRRSDIDRPAAPDAWKFTTKNALMFQPDGMDEQQFQSVAERAQHESLAPPKKIVYENTRLPGTSLLAEQQSRSEDRRPPSPTLSAVRDALAGRPRARDRDSLAGSMAGSMAGSTMGGNGGETPRVNGYAYVEEEDDVDEEEQKNEPPIEFGKVDATPNPFQLQAKSKREGLHHRMVERIAQSKRTSARIGLTGRADTASSVRSTISSSMPSSPRVVRGNLTPAGQRLLSKIGGGRQRNAITAFNAGGQKNQKGSRRARLREQRRFG